jgi:hypothetical protein
MTTTDDETRIDAELEQAKAIVAKVAPGNHPELACMLVASALAGMRGLTMKHIRIGALWWPDKFAEENPYLSMRGGWGIDATDVGSRQLYLAETSVDEDGGFNGHTWLEPEPETVDDLMHGVENGMREIYDADFKVVGRYIPRPPLERAVKKFWRKEMLDAIKFGKAAVQP